MGNIINYFPYKIIWASTIFDETVCFLQNNKTTKTSWELSQLHDMIIKLFSVKCTFKLLAV